MKETEDSLMDMVVLPEEMLEIAANQLGTGDNNFKKFLEAGVILKTAGLHPVFMCSPDLKHLKVTTEEKLRKKLH
jgi:hypothetical protein